MLAEKVTSERMARGYSGTARTIDLMHKLVQKAKLDPTMHRIATLIRSQVPQDYRGGTRATADAIFNWVRKHGMFQRDQFQIERVEHPISSMQTLVKARQAGLDTHGKLFAGDCDQYAIWIASLGGILGFQYAFETSKSDMERPDEFSHVWASLLVGPEWVAYDASTKGATPNWRPPISGPDKFKRWPEKEIERSGVGSMGLGEVPFGVPADYFGNNIPDDSPIDPIIDSDPGRLDMLPPEQPLRSEAEMRGDLPWVDKQPTPDPSDRMSLIENDDTGPYYMRTKDFPRYRLQKNIYPPRSPWNRFAQSSEDRAKGEPYYKTQKSTVPTDNVTIATQSPLTLDQKGGRPSVVRRQIKSTLIVRRPQMVPAGVSAVEAQTWDSLNEPAPSDTTKVATDAGKGVMDIISNITSGLAPAAKTIIDAKYAAAVSKATNSVVRAPVTTPSTYMPKPFWQQSWLWLGLGIVAAGGAAVVMLKPAKRRGR